MYMYARQICNGAEGGISLFSRMCTIHQDSYYVRIIINMVLQKQHYTVITAVIFVFVAIIVVVLVRGPNMVTVVIPPGLRKEEIATILATDLQWTDAEKQSFLVASTSVNYPEGIYFPDTYRIPPREAPETTARRLVGNFNLKFAPYQQGALNDNIKWTVLLTMASIIQREAASSSDMALISGILWNRLNINMPLDVDSTVQYARGYTSSGWWAPITPNDLKIDSPFNTYINKGLPPYPIDNPGLPAINAALNPEKTDCLYYLHDLSKTIHCSAMYAGQQANVEKYLQ